MRHRNFTRDFQPRIAADGRQGNPFFRKSERPWLRRGVALGIPAIAGIAFLLFLFLPMFRLTNVQAEGLTTLPSEEVTQTAKDILSRRILLVVPASHLMLYPKNRISETLNERYHFAALNLHRQGRNLVISAQERITEIAWQTAEQTLLLDLNGVVVAEASDEVKVMIDARLANAAEVPSAPGIQPTMPIIRANRKGTSAVGDTVLSAGIISTFLELDKGLRERQLTPRAFDLGDEVGAWCTVTIIDWPNILVDLASTPASTTLENFDILRKERGDALRGLQYIDLRFGEHVYLK